MSHARLTELNSLAAARLIVVRPKIPIVEAALLSLLMLAAAPVAEPISSSPANTGHALIEVPATPAKGFQYSYLLFVPKSAEGKPSSYLLVEPNNTSDDLEIHRAAAVALARDSSVGNFVALKLGVPLLVPVFPRADQSFAGPAHRRRVCTLSP